VENTVEYRRTLKQKTPSVFLDRKHTINCRVLPDRQALLSELPSGGVAAEVGVAFGDFTKQIVALNRPRKLHLLDVWGSARYEEGLRQVKMAQADLIAEGVVEIHRGLSTDQLPTFPDSYFDWVYIDTDHTYETTYQELVIAATKVKSGGFISGHDFCPGNVITPWPYGVIEACNKFCVEFEWEYRLITIEPHGHQSFCIARR